MEIDRLGQQLEKMQSELATYQDLLSVKDEQIVKLTNQIHELELKNVMCTSVPPSPGGPRLNLSSSNLQKIAVCRTTSNGISFDSDRGEFKEFIDVGVQTNDRASLVSFSQSIMSYAHLHIHCVPRTTVSFQRHAARSKIDRFQFFSLNDH